MLWSLCQTASASSIFDQIGWEQNVSPQILWGIALQESSHPEKNRPWPWSVNVNGKSYFFSSKRNAVEFSAKEINKGKSVDIGLMQVNWKWHKQRFSSLSQAFDPVTNLRVAATILKQFKRYPKWVAVGKYHCPSEVSWCLAAANSYSLKVQKRLMQL